MRDQYTREKFDWEPSVPSLALSSAFEIRAQGSAPSATTEVDSYLVAAFRVSTVFFIQVRISTFFLPRPTNAQRRRTALLGPCIVPRWEPRLDP